MAQIVEPERAARLARAILADILLYHEAELRDASPKLTAVLQEGRELFQTRVDHGLHPVFERAIAESRLAPWGSATPEIAPPGELNSYRAPPAFPLAPMAPPEPQSSGMGVPLLLGVVALLVAAYFLLR